MISTLPPATTLRLSAVSSKDNTFTGRFSIDRYHGAFPHSPALQARANLGYWYARAVGSPCELEGEGSTPEGALADLLKRAAEMRDEITRVYSLPVVPAR